MAVGLPWWLLPRSIRELPADLAAILLWVGLTMGAVFVPGINETPLRVVFGLPLVLFVPGYALIAALFPEAGSAPSDDGADPTGAEKSESGIDGIERVALSFGLSIAVVPLLGLVLNFTPWGIRLVPIMLAISGMTIGFVAIAATRRRALPEADRFAVPYRSWLRATREELLHPETRIDGALNVLLALSVILAVASVGYAVAVPKQGESFTELYLLTETEDGELVADDYPTEYTRNEAQSLIVGVTNQEHRATNYTLVVELQRVAFVNNTTTRVTEQRQLKRFRLRLSHNETRQITHRISPPMTGQRLRLTYLLYRGAAPPAPSIETAYREVHLWINVSAPSTSA